ncbi:MAG TPA: 50S ribosomal protein L25/general stress protein Ctc [Actinoallomurus sp.]|nr:50S ribosomal protein L25/general stress protein Ctc [Actinoallomurus sp.]
MSEVRIAAEPRTEFGKGPARRTRRAGKVPAVLYGHGTDPRHISLPGHELMLALKSANVLLRVQGLDGGEELALPKDVQRDPLKGFLEHVDLVVVTRGEKVTVEVPIQLTGDIAPDGMLDQQLIQVSLEVEATHIPQAVEVSVEGMVVGDAIHAKDLKLPTGATLDAEDDALVLHVIAAPTAAQMEAELGEGEAAEGEAAAEGEGAAAEGETKPEGGEE